MNFFKCHLNEKVDLSVINKRHTDYIVEGKF